MSIYEIQKSWRDHKRNCDLASYDITIYIASSMTVDQIEPYIGKYLLDKGFNNPNIIIGPFNQIQQICRSYDDFFSKEPDVILVLWRLEDIFQNLESNSSSIIYDGVLDLADSVECLREKYKGILIVSSPPYPMMSSFDLSSISSQLYADLYSSVCVTWKENIELLNNVQILEMNDLYLKIGMDNVCDKRKWYLYRQPWAEKFCAVVGRHIGRMISANKVSAKKCIVLDADNTLWGGIIGEDGMEGILLSEEFPGNTYRDFQKHLLHLQKQGIMLAVASKNNEDDFFEVLDNHDAMVLKREHFLSFQVHWESKAKSIINIAKDLNISTDAIIFVDDNPKEIAEVQNMLPEVVCEIVPEELSDLPYLLTDTDYFDFVSLTKEDLMRNEMMKASKSRDEVKVSMSEEEFKKSLELEASFFMAESQHVARVTQLINKTNQFNLTTLRRTKEEVELLLASDDYKVMCMYLKDKFGEYGLVGVTILQREAEECIIDTLLMSCRVLGRDVETAFLYQILQIAKDWKCKSVKGKYIPTKKNMLVENLYKDHGFVLGDDEGFWEFNLNENMKAPDHINIISDI